MNVFATWIHMGRSIIADPEPLLTGSMRMRQLLGLASICRMSSDAVRSVLMDEYVNAHAQDAWIRALLDDVSGLVFLEDDKIVVMDRILRQQLPATGQVGNIYLRKESMGRILASFRQNGTSLALAKIDLKFRRLRKLVPASIAVHEYAVDISVLESYKQHLYSLSDVIDLCHETWGSSERLREEVRRREDEREREIDRRASRTERHLALQARLGDGKCLWSLRIMKEISQDISILADTYVDGDDDVLPDLIRRASEHTRVLSVRLGMIVEALQGWVELIPECIRDHVSEEPQPRLTNGAPPAVTLTSSRARTLCSLGGSSASHMCHWFMKTGQSEMLQSLHEFMLRAVDVILAWEIVEELPMSVEWAMRASAAYLRTDQVSAEPRPGIDVVLRDVDAYVACQCEWRNHNAMLALGDRDVRYVSRDCFLEALSKFRYRPRDPKSVLNTAMGLQITRLAAEIESQSSTRITIINVINASIVDTPVLEARRGF